jgi:hypothetical protein
MAINERIHEMTPEELGAEVLKLRFAIRKHRDQKGDERCHLDDDLLYEALPESNLHREKRKLPCNFLENCKAFFAKRQEVEYGSVEELYAGWDKDKPYLSSGEIDTILGLFIDTHDTARGWRPGDDEICQKLEKMK